uniref:Ig-like domain-containing protein n=1 Tax=Peronospora matthiolae TaxID=2874970 RepID=A0AAV1VM17_9STRA
MQLMENMAATGLGADVPILTASVHTPELAESPRSDDDEDEVKRDYMAVDDDESEANCGSTWSTVEALAGGSESCEKHSTQKEMYCTGDAPELAKQELCASISTRSVDSGTSATELYKVDSISCNSSSRRLCLEWHSCGDPEEAHVLSDFPHQDETVLAAAVTTSAATIDCTTALTRESAATQSTSDFGESTSSCISSDGSQVSGQGEEMQPTEFTQRPRGSISHCEEMNGVANEESTAVAKDEQPEKKDVLIHTVNSTENELEDDQTVEISSGEGNVREYENLGNSAQSDGREPPQESRMVRAALRVSTERLVGSEAKSESLETIKAAVTSKRKESSELQGDFAKSDICDEHVSSACTSTPAHSPQWSTHASKKKRKKSPSQPEHTRSRSLRRSPRVKTKPPELTRLERKRMANPVVLTHLDRQYGNSASSPAPSGMVCKSGGAQVTASRGEAAIHLEKCRSFGRKVSQLDEADDVEDKAPASPSAPSTVQAVKTESGCDEPGVAYALVDLMGTKALAAKLKRSFQSATFSGHAPVSRFQHLIGDDVTGLRHLNVYRLLDAVNQLDGPILQLHLRWPGVRRTTGQDQVDPVSKQKLGAWKAPAFAFLHLGVWLINSLHRWRKS